MKLRWVLAPALLLLALSPLWLRECGGPRAEATVTSLEQTDAGVRVWARIENRGGEGQVDVTARLRGKDGQSYAGTVSAPLRRKEPLNVAIDVAAPRGEYAPEITAEFPPK